MLWSNSCFDALLVTDIFLLVLGKIFWIEKIMQVNQIFLPQDENCEDIPEDLEKTLLIEPKTPTPSTPRGRNRGRGGTAQRSRGRKRK